VESVTVDFEADAEPWSTYTLADGTVLKIRAVVSGVTRFEGEFDNGGNPVYVVNTNMVSRVVKSKIRGEPTIMKGAKPADKHDPAVG
jgi:hypothetical protein